LYVDGLHARLAAATGRESSVPFLSIPLLSQDARCSTLNASGDNDCCRPPGNHRQREESVMTRPLDSKPDAERLAAPLKAAVWIAVVGFVVLAVETPHWTMAPDAQHLAAPVAAPPSATPPADYFPARFPAPKAEPEVQPPTF
jgi:hypothetical protein